MHVYSFDGRLLGLGRWAGEHLLLSDNDGQEMLLRPAVVFYQDGDEMRLVCYEGTLSYWQVAD